MTATLAGFNSDHLPIVAGSCCAGNVRYYSALLTASQVIIDSGETRLPLRHSHHRYSILGPNGVQTLTVPLVGATNAMSVPMRDVEISNHGKWRHLHWGALFSAYGKTPYFDYLAGDLERIIAGGNQRFLLDLNNELHGLIVEFADLPVNTVVTSEVPHDAVVDLRGKIAGKRPDNLVIKMREYHQLWSDRHGFVPDLSIIDLVANAGREAIYTLMQ